LHIEIREIDNGFLVSFFDENTPANIDRVFHAETMKEVLDETVLYYEKVLKFRSEKEASEQK